VQPRGRSDGYALRDARPEVGEASDYVMHWWQQAARLVLDGRARRFGLITTNSIAQGFNQRVVDAQLKGGGTIAYAVPDHPWVDEKNGAHVRVAMTVFVRDEQPGRLELVVDERRGELGQTLVRTEQKLGRINSALTLGLDLSSLVRLRANRGLTCPGVQLSGQGFVLNSEQAKEFSRRTQRDLIRPYVTGRDLTKVRRERFVLDTFGKTEAQLKDKYPDAYQWLRDRVRPARLLNPRASYAQKWWSHSEPRSKFRGKLAGLPRYIGTSRTARHRVFQFLPSEALAETKVLVIASDDAAILGVLSSRVHDKSQGSCRVFRYRRRSTFRQAA